MKRKNKAILIYFLTVGGIITWLFLIFWAPYLKSRHSGISSYIYAVFSPFCHQIPTRSFSIFHHPLAVCARCLGIYSGFLAGTGLYPFIRGFSKISLPKVKGFILVSLPIVMDTIGNFFHLWMTSSGVRFLIGFIWGLILPFYFITGILDISIWGRSPKGHPAKHIYD